MADRKSNLQGSDRRKKRYRSDGSPIWGKRVIGGPGVWVSCVKGKEKQTVGELYDLFESLASDIWPVGDIHHDIDDPDTDPETPDEGLSIEAQITKEVSSMKRPRTEQRFTNCQTNTPCVVFIACKPPVDPVKLIEAHVQNVKNTGVTRTRYTHRFVPVSGTCVTNLPEIQALCRSVITPFFEKKPDKKYSYKIELRTRNHTTLSRPTIIDHVAACVPEGHTVDLTDPQVFILVEVFKSVFGISITEEYYSLFKFNVMEIANSTGVEKTNEEGRVFNRSV